MVIARAPVRISFGGGGTDLAAYYEPFGGFVVSAAIARYASVTARPSLDGWTRIHSADYGITEICPPGATPDIAPPLALPKAALAACAARGLALDGVDLWLSSEAPPGAGLGSSSAMAVALLTALSALAGKPLTAHATAELACDVEIERLEAPIGKQDQYASAFGGLNAIAFSPGGVDVEPLDLPRRVTTALSRNLLLFATGATRNAADVLTEQRAATRTDAAVIASLHRIKALAYAMRDALVAGDIDGLGRLLDRGWQEKKRLSTRISSGRIDACYAAALEAGALGGKLVGAGAGGFLLLYCPPERQPNLRAAMRARQLAELTFVLERQGARVITREPAQDADILAVGE